MSAPGHCRHCRDGCTLGDTCEFRHVNENWTAAWDDECCPRATRLSTSPPRCIEWAEGCYQRGGRRVGNQRDGPLLQGATDDVHTHVA